MAERYRVILEKALATRLRALRRSAAADPGGPDARLLTAGLKSARALKHGHERDFSGERLGFSPNHYDLRDCAEVKVPVVQEYTRSGKPRGPSHRMIYREFHPPQEDQLPIRQVLAFEHRANGLPFAVAAAALDRPKGRGIEALKDLPATRPAIGKNKDPNRPVSAPRLSLPPDIAAALKTANAKHAATKATVLSSPTPHAASTPRARGTAQHAQSAGHGRTIGR